MGCAEGCLEVFDRFAETHDWGTIRLGRGRYGGCRSALTLSTESEMVLESIPASCLDLVAAREEEPSEETGEVLYGAVKLERE